MMKGTHHTPEAILRLRKANLGKKYSEEYKKHMSEVKKGYVFSDEHKKNISKAKSGKNHHFYGKKQSPEHIEKRTSKIRGDKNYNWKGGITPINAKIRNSHEYKLLREACFKRDKYTCIWCGKSSGNGKAVVLHADHIKPFSIYPELRFALDNLRTLCKECHKTTDTFAGRMKNFQPGI